MIKRLTLALWAALYATALWAHPSQTPHETLWYYDGETWYLVEGDTRTAAFEFCTGTDCILALEGQPALQMTACQWDGEICWIDREPVLEDIAATSEII